MGYTHTELDMRSVVVDVESELLDPLG